MTRSLAIYFPPPPVCVPTLRILVITFAFRRTLLSFATFVLPNFLQWPSREGGVCPGGCLPRGLSALGVSAYMGVCLGGVCLVGCLPRGMCLPGCVCLGGVCLVGCTLPPPPPVNRMTDACKNITFPQLLLQTVI